MENEKTTRKQLFEINLNLILPGIPSTSSPRILLPFSKGKALGTSIPIYSELTPLQHSRKNRLVFLSAAVRLRIGWRKEGGKNRRAKRDERYIVAARFASRIFPIWSRFLPFFPTVEPVPGLKSSQPANADLFPVVASLSGWREEATTGNTSAFAG